MKVVELDDTVEEIETRIEAHIDELRQLAARLQYIIREIDKTQRMYYETHYKTHHAA